MRAFLRRILRRFDAWAISHAYDEAMLALSLVGPRKKPSSNHRPKFHT